MPKPVQKLIVVEHRCNGETLLAFLGSTWEMAEAFCRGNKDYDDGKEGPWWWVLYEMSVDVDPTTSDAEEWLEDLRFMSPEGVYLAEQPSRGW